MSHLWHERFGLTCCKRCGIVRRADDQNKPCPGPVRLGLRNRIGDRFLPSLHYRRDGRMSRQTEFCENEDGVHVQWGEFTLCGDSFDIGTTEGEDCGDFTVTAKRTVTCPNCIAIIDTCRGVRTKDPTL